MFRRGADGACDVVGERAAGKARRRGPADPPAAIPRREAAAAARDVLRPYGVTSGLSNTLCFVPAVPGATTTAGDPVDREDAVLAGKGAFLLRDGEQERGQRRRGAIVALLWTAAWHAALLLLSLLMVTPALLESGWAPLPLLLPQSERPSSIEASRDEEAPAKEDLLERLSREDWPEPLPDLQRLSEAAPQPSQPDIAPPEAAPIPDITEHHYRVPKGPMPPIQCKREPQPAPQAPPAPVISGVNEAPESMRQRFGDELKRALEEHGGGGDTLAAVDNALAFLARFQLDDGSWSADGRRMPADRPRFTRPASWSGADIGVSALALLCFMGRGHTATEGEYRDAVSRGLDWLLRQQMQDGSFSVSQGMQDPIRLYNTGVAALALCEACCLHQRQDYQQAARSALQFFVRSQNTRGGWTYTSGGTSTRENRRTDASITGWIVLAFHVAREAGFTTHEPTVKKMESAYHELTDRKTGETRYADMDPFSGRRGIGMTGVGLVARRLLAPQRFADVDAKALALLDAQPPEWENLLGASHDSDDPNFESTYGWYYGTLGAFMATGGRGPVWKRWNTHLKSALLSHQSAAGADAGSWPPDESWLGPYYGRLYSTTMSCLALEIYFRYKPDPARVLDGKHAIPRTH